MDTGEDRRKFLGSSSLQSPSEEDSNGASKYHHPKVMCDKRLWMYIYNNRYFLGSLFVGAIVLWSSFGFGSTGRTFKLASWNMAAINNNPFEYWITYDENPKYNKLMLDVENFIVNPGNQDVPIKDVFTDDMFRRLKAIMQNQNWEGLDIVERMWNEEYKNRRIVSEFLKDKMIGSKRLASMLDRVTNTLNLANGQQIYRPTAINMYEGGKMDTTEEWFNLWLDFIFEIKIELKAGESTHISELLQPIKRKKYPDVTEEEEQVSIPLQTVIGAVFDCVLIHMLNTVAQGEWMAIKMELGNKLNKNKLGRSMKILAAQYSDRDVIFLQEVSAAFVSAFPDSPLKNDFELHYPIKLDGKRDQNSMILTNKKLLFKKDREVTEDVLSTPADAVGCGDGDLFAMHGSIDGTEYILASFHGDTNGLQTIPITRAMNMAMLEKFNGKKLIFGLDANVYEKDSSKTQSYMGYVDAFKNLELNSCFGEDIDKSSYTTYNARTYLQAQLNKACKFEERKSCGDVNPKDFIIFYDTDFAPGKTSKDNTGKKSYINDMCFPTLDFPSDHAILSAVIESKPEVN